MVLAVTDGVFRFVALQDLTWQSVMRSCTPSTPIHFAGEKSDLVIMGDRSQDGIVSGALSNGCVSKEAAASPRFNPFALPLLGELPPPQPTVLHGWPPRQGKR